MSCDKCADRLRYANRGRTRVALIWLCALVARMSESRTPAEKRRGLARSAHLAVLLVTQTVLAAELVLLVMSEHWLHVFLVTGLMIGILTPELLKRRLRVEIPSEVQIIAILFVFAALFLGEVRDYYERIWWWDEALHSTAGLLLGLLGFLTVHAMNAHRDFDRQVRPSFVALFAFLFSLGVGALWEIFEFTMDQTLGLTMQTPMLGDPSGLTDTMWDLIIEAVTAAAISLAGWRYIKRSRRRYIDTWIGRFIRRNHRLVRQRSAYSSEA